MKPAVQAAAIGYTPPVTEAQIKGAAAVAIVGALLASLGTLGPWITLSSDAGSISRSGLDYSGDAKWVIALAVLAMLSAVSRLTGWQIPRILRRWLAIDGAVALGLCIYNAVQVQSRGDSVRPFGITVQVGAGLWISLAGSALVIVGAVTMIGGVERLRDEWQMFLGHNPMEQRQAKPPDPRQDL